MSPLSGLIALIVMLPVILLLAFLEHHCDTDEEWADMRPPPDPRRNTWPEERIEA